jgi:hypothetical protein
MTFCELTLIEGTNDYRCGRCRRIARDVTVLPVVRPCQSDQPQAPQHGPGSQLKRLLRIIKLFPVGGCQCDARALEMDQRGCNWCRANLGTILGWLHDEARRRSLPFVEAVAHKIVVMAIDRAEKAVIDRS